MLLPNICQLCHTGLVIITDAGKGIEAVVEDVYLGIEHRECMRHLWKNMKKSYTGTLYGKNMWAVAKSFTTDKFNFFMRNIEEKDPRHLSGWMRTIHTYGVEANSQKTAR